jgi:hypothetical protein
MPGPSAGFDAAERKQLAGMLLRIISNVEKAANTEDGSAGEAGK